MLGHPTHLVRPPASLLGQCPNFCSFYLLKASLTNPIDRHADQEVLDQAVTGNDADALRHYWYLCHCQLKYFRHRMQRRFFICSLKLRLFALTINLFS